MAKKRGAPKQEPEHHGSDDEGRAYLNHGVASLVAMDNPDDFQPGEEGERKEGGTGGVRHQ